MILGDFLASLLSSESVIIGAMTALTRRSSTVILEVYFR